LQTTLIAVSENHVKSIKKENGDPEEASVATT